MIEEKGAGARTDEGGREEDEAEPPGLDLGSGSRGTPEDWWGFDYFVFALGSGNERIDDEAWVLFGVQP